MDPSNGYRKEFVHFVEQVFSTASLEYYRVDVQKLLTLILKCQLEGEKEWYAAHFDPLSQYCGYFLAKMSYDVRQAIQQTPDWLSALAGFLDQPGGNRFEQKKAFDEIGSEVRSLLKKYGPDARATLPPPPDEEN